MTALPPDDRASEPTSEPMLDGPGGLNGHDGLGGPSGPSGRDASPAPAEATQSAQSTASARSASSARPAQPDLFDAELAAFLDDLGQQVRPHEFDSHAILRRTARRRSYRVLAASAAGLAVVVGATAFAAVNRDGVPSPAANHPNTATSSGLGTDPLTVPGYFRTAPDGNAANGFTQFGGTTYAVNYVVTGADGMVTQGVDTDWTLHGVEVQAEVNWFGAPQTGTPVDAGHIVATVNGHPAYYNAQSGQLQFWTGPEGYATAIIFTDSTGDQDPFATSADMLDLARSLVTKPVAAPMPVQITGLDSATVTYAGVGWIAEPVRMKSSTTEPWDSLVRVTIDGRSYDIDAAPGPAVTPSATGNEKTSGLVSAEENVDGLGITVSTDSGKQGSPSAPTPAQVLTHVTSLGTSPSGWTTSVIVP